VNPVVGIVPERDVERLEDGTWRTWATCQDCGVRRPLDSDEQPGRLALAIAPLLLCQSCGLEAARAEDRATRERRLQEYLRESGMPEPLLRAATWDSLLEDGKTPDDTVRRRDAIAAAKAWAGERRPERGLLLHGPAGSGKTRLAATAAVARMAHSPIRWVSVGVLMAQLDGAWNDDERAQALKVLTSKGPVVLDDFDKVNPNARLQAALFTALDKREQSGAAIIVTTNLAPAELERRFSEAIVSRLAGMCRILRYPGPDRRLAL
jgi:DNA replication protein DnaC